MRKKALITLAIVIIVVLLLATFLLSNQNLFGSSAPKKTQPVPEAPVYVGVTYCGDNITEAKMLIDKVKNYTNLFVIQSGAFLADVEATNAICSYAVESGLHVIVYFSAALDYRQYLTSFLSTADAWGSNLLGVYFDDEPGGKMLDSQHSIYFYDESINAVIEKSPKFLKVIKEDGTRTYYLVDGSVLDYESFGIVRYQPDENIGFEGSSTDYVVKPNGTIYVVESNKIGAELTDDVILEKIDAYQQIMAKKPFQTYDDTARVFVNTIQNSTGWFHSQTNTKAFTSDYALDWFDYQAGYDVVLAQLGWGQNVTQNIARIRGAATMQGRSWGTIVTWASTQAPYLMSGDQMFEEMRQSYRSGANYVVVFNYDQSYNFVGENSTTSGTALLGEEHFAAIEKFWNEVVVAPDETNKAAGSVAFVLPQYYGWGMRFSEDKIWGIWKADNTTRTIWDNLQAALAKYGSNLDIVYNDPAYPLVSKYLTVIDAFG